MRIAGLEKCSMVDFPGRLAAVVFTPGCNWDCFFCHNQSLLSDNAATSGWDPEIVLGWLEERRGFLDGVVITGGEPTLQPGLRRFVREVREKGFSVKLDTNGTHPEALAPLIDESLLNYVAMDIKAPVEKYEAFCGVPVDHRVINRSIDLLLGGRVDYEFRTTAVPQLTESDIFAIARRIRGARKFVLQQYRRQDASASPPHSADWPWQFMDDLRQVVAHCETRGFEMPTDNARSNAA